MRHCGPMRAQALPCVGRRPGRATDGLSMSSSWRARCSGAASPGELGPQIGPRPTQSNSAERRKPRRNQGFLTSGRQDLNLRPPGPQPGALPDCATPRDGSQGNAWFRPRVAAQAAAGKRKARVQRTKFLLEYCRSHPCTDCGGARPRDARFDHLRDKASDIGTGIINVGWATLLGEIEKCEVVCANCHRRRTSQRRGPCGSGSPASTAEERATGLEPVLSAWKADVQPVTPRPRGDPDASPPRDAPRSARHPPPPRAPSAATGRTSCRRRRRA